MKRLLYILLLVISWNTLTAQTYQVNNQKIRFMNALGIPAKDTTAANWANAADTSIILIRPQDSTLWYKYKGSFRKVGTGGSAAIVDTTIISTKAYRNKGFDSIRAVYVPFTGSMSNVNLNARELTNVSRLLVNRTSSFQGALQVTTSGGGVLIDADNSNFGLAIRNTSSSNKSWDFSPFNNDFTINEGGVATRLYFQAGGNIGVNNITPTEALDITGNAKATSFIKSGGTSSQFLKADGSVDNNTYTTSTNVSTLITDSLRALVRLRAQGSGGIDVQNSSGTSVASFGSGGTTNISLNGSTNVNARLNVTDSIVGVNQRLTGNIQAATFNGSALGSYAYRSSGLAELSGATFTGGVAFNSAVTTFNNDNQYLQFNRSNVAFAYIGTAANTTGGTITDLGIRAENNLRLGIGNNTHVILNSSGNVGIGTTSPTHKLDVQGGNIVNGNGTIQTAITYATGGIIGTLSNHALSIYTNNTERINISASTGAATFSGALTATAQGNNITIGVDSSVTTTTYTLVLGDAGYLKRCDNGSAITITVPTNASVAFPIGTTIYFSQQGNGKVSVSPATSDVTIQSEGNLLGTAGQHAVIGLIKVNTNRWLLVGNRG